MGGEAGILGDVIDDHQLAAGADLVADRGAQLELAARLQAEGDLVAQANDSAYGLAAGIWTGDYRRAWRIARALEAGTVWINTYKQLSIAAPFGGFKDSGVGREKGIGGLRLYQQAKSVYWGLDAPPAQ